VEVINKTVSCATSFSIQYLAWLLHLQLHFNPVYDVVLINNTVAYATSLCIQYLAWQQNLDVCLM